MPNDSTLFEPIRKYLASQEGKQPAANPIHEGSVQKLSQWLTKRGKQKSEVVVVCTGNSRRSILTSTLGNVIAVYRSWPGVRFYSAGTAPSAFNSRTITALKAIGVEITATGNFAKPGNAGEKNPQYQVRWGKGKDDFTLEYSKALGDALLPVKDFAALLVCSEADKECPTVTNAGLRVAMPFEDPKAFDGKPNEAEEYAKTRDLIAQILLKISIT